MRRWLGRCAAKGHFAAGRGFWLFPSAAIPKVQVVLNALEMAAQAGQALSNYYGTMVVNPSKQMNNIYFKRAEEVFNLYILQNILKHDVGNVRALLTFVNVKLVFCNKQFDIVFIGDS